MQIGRSAATIVSEVPAWNPWCNMLKQPPCYILKHGPFLPVQSYPTLIRALWQSPLSLPHSP